MTAALFGGLEAPSLEMEAGVSVLVGSAPVLLNVAADVKARLRVEEVEVVGLVL